MESPETHYCTPLPGPSIESVSISGREDQYSSQPCGLDTPRETKLRQSFYVTELKVERVGGFYHTENVPYPYQAPFKRL